MKLHEITNYSDSILPDLIDNALASGKPVIASGTFYNGWLEAGKGGFRTILGKILNRADDFVKNTVNDRKVYANYVVEDTFADVRMNIHIDLETADDNYTFEKDEHGRFVLIAHLHTTGK
jgi:hypothetical protein